MRKSKPMIVVVLDLPTRKIVGITAVNETGSYPENHVEITDDLMANTIAAHFAKEPSPYNYQNDLYLINDSLQVKPNMGIVKHIKINELYTACTLSCTGGFTSCALGVEHSYPSKEIDQHNLHAAALTSTFQIDSWSTLVWCSEKSAWNMRSHSKRQVQQLLGDMVAFIDSNRAALKQLIDKINTVSDEPTSENARQVRLIQWNKI
jgi:hypothetical protein